MIHFDAMLGALSRQEVAYIVVGGASAIAHGSARFTQVLDLVYARSAVNLDRVVRALQPFQPYLRGGATRLAVSVGPGNA